MSARWHPSAEAELNDVAAFYVARDLPSVAIAFVDEVQRVVEVVCATPTGGAPLRDGLRKWRLHGSIVYRDKGDHIALRWTVKRSR
ncbi:MAG TPA: type II toxin-antitoxin system RelE/ParE family toxin [Planctomycetota bacterium]|nr:type II toxin-antitoxin system RelE/ParE family toxin [Planctomycetota bacterium]